jgi:uncharacterized membrane protein YdfJ with MMPL/SSD domain
VIVIGIWVIAAVYLFLFAPKMSEVGVTDDSQFLPQNTESSEADRLLKEKFASVADETGSNAIILVYNENGLNDDDFSKAQSIHNWLTSDNAPQEIKQVTSVFTDESLRSTLISSDQTSTMIIVGLSVDPLADAAKTAISQIRDYLQAIHSNGHIYFTGETTLIQDMLSSVEETIDRTTIVTIILVAILLLIIYRSPIAMFLPLIAIGCSFAVSMGLIGFLGQAGAKFFTLTEAYLIVIIFGVGTDYCLFIVSRFREELQQKERNQAQSNTLKHIGPVIAASALTVVVAFLALGISKYGMNQTTGYAMALGVAITLLAGLTLVPALMALFGKYLFWPIKISAMKHETRSGWKTIGLWVSRHPLIVALPITAILLLPYIALPHLERSSDVVNQLPQGAESVKGYKLMAEHFDMGELSPSYILIESKDGLITTPASLQAIEEIVQSVVTVPGISRINHHATPVTQLSILSLQLRSIGGVINHGGDLAQLVFLSTAGQSLQNMALQYPGIVYSTNFQLLAINMEKLSTLAGQITVTPPESLPAMLAELQAAMYQASDNLDGLISEFKLELDTPFTNYLYATYFSSDRTIARINIIFSSDPNSAETLETVKLLRDVLVTGIESTTLNGSLSYLGGESATRADIMLISDADFGMVVAISIVGILVVIAVLLRSILAPLYMVITVLLNYGTTLGIATWLFLDLVKQESMIYMIPLLLFTILVALGADYNIFLVSRIREEAQNKSIKEAVSKAVASTGGVITACGIILAGTFATLMTSPLQVVFQIGAAISIGVLIDTFMIRALLVPAIATIAGRWSWWPSRLFRRLSK